MMKVLLVHPISPTVNNIPPLGLAYLGAVLENAGCSVKIIDAAARYADYTSDDIRREVSQYAPDVIGVTIYTNFSEYGLDLMRALSAFNIPIVAGGPHPTIFPDESLDNCARIVVRGEGEKTIRELIEYFRGERKLEDILGISYRKDDRSYHTEPRPLIQNLDSLPFPALNLFNKSDYIQTEAERHCFGRILTSRGCPFRCIYCSKAITGNTYRLRSAANIVAEISSLVRMYNLEYIRFLDDTLTVNRERVLQLCDLLQQHQPELKWTCVTRLDCVDEDLLRRMKEAGCVTVNYGIESGSPATLQRIRKGITVAQAREAVLMTQRTGLGCSVNFMFGFPGESIEELRKTFHFIRELSKYVKVIMPTGVLIPFPGTEIYEEYNMRYDFKEWWRKGRLTMGQTRDQTPLFKRIGFDFTVLEADFFKYDRETRREIARIGHFIESHNMWIAAGKLSSHAPVRHLIHMLLVGLIRSSSILCKMNPKLEQLIMGPFLLAAEKYQHLNI